MSTRVNGLRKWIVTFYQLFRHYVYPIRRDPISILDLDLDILWTIFTINADIDDPGALNSTLMNSQVCSSWHNLLLTTPSIWGRLLNLDVLSKGGNIRPAEILRRSGSSSLWIKADITGAPHLKEFFFNIVDQHWQRIKYLDISLPSNLVTFERWNVFCLPAPHLETFKVCIRHTGGLTRRGLHQVAHTWSNSHHLFANEAPMLREFYVTQYKFDHPPGWVTRLSALRIGYPFTLQEALFAVQEIPNLESFVISTLKVTVNPDTIQRLPHIYSTKLNFCALYGHFELREILNRRLNFEIIIDSDEATIRNLHKFYDDIEAHGGTSDRMKRGRAIKVLSLRYSHATLFRPSNI
ncbi:hypothetical protein CPB84DRAFT_1822121 [Gymnopilus junonius]|uniref:F-box domain-containing protein n=1 Tax=Gymnopilus junonius TaxID=109634 RepID=A0A9P5TSD7_GYMJU|nr:hypothetical protein CPB84DRAFT_1822121 [Gymnopilus junonius]